MKYMLLMSTPCDGYKQFMSWPKRRSKPTSRSCRISRNGSRGPVNS